MSEIVESRILIAEDNIIVKKMLVDQLRELGFQSDRLYSAHNGESALKMALEFDFDLIISDWDMPALDGLDLLKAIRANEKTKGVAFIMITGQNDKTLVEEAIQIGATDYLLKPFTPFDLSEKLKRIFSNSNDYFKIRWTNLMGPIQLTR